MTNTIPPIQVHKMTPEAILDEWEELIYKGSLSEEETSRYKQLRLEMCLRMRRAPSEY